MTYVDTAFKPLTALSLCPGIRGLERGVERITGRLHTLAYVEIEAFIIENLLAAMETGYLDPAPIWSNLKTFEQFAPWFRGCVDLILGGYPCQPFSNAGTRLGTGDPRHLWPYIKNIARIIGPRACFFENVAGHLSLGYDIVRRDLQELGYTVKEGIFSAEEVGAPHQRKRLFILAISGGGGLAELANAIRYGTGANAGDTFRTGQAHESEAQRQEWDEVLGQRCGANARYGSADAAYSSSSKLEEWKEQPTQQELQAAERGSGDVAYSNRTGLAEQRNDRKSITSDNSGVEYSGTHDRWPSRPGISQQAWESPRTFESRLGCSIDGYNYREDLLRAFGNAVVDQTATLAFETLLNEHLNAELL